MLAASYAPKRRMTDARLAFLSELEQTGIGNPKSIGTTLSYLLKLKWVERVVELPDGRRMSVAEHRAEIGRRGVLVGVNLGDVKFVGVRLTSEGRAWLAKARRGR